jgi:hypothetical protein
MTVDLFRNVALPLSDCFVSYLLPWQNTESVRNFLIDKLKAAETEIKSLMAAGSALKKQAVSDQEVCMRTSVRAFTNRRISCMDDLVCTHFTFCLCK